MGTNSRIVVQGVTGTCRSIHCQYDGYLDGVGMMLFEHHHSSQSAIALIQLGDLSALGKEIGQKHDFEWASKWSAKNRDRFRGDDDLTDWDAYYEAKNAQPESQWCLSYLRDRGETDCEAQTHASLPKAVAIHGEYEYLYLWSRGTWWHLAEVDLVDPENSTWVLLYDAIKASEACVKVLAKKRQRYPEALPTSFRRPARGPMQTAGAIAVHAPMPTTHEPVAASAPSNINVVVGRTRTITL